MQLLESMVKNCGAPIQQEVATKEMMDFMREQILVYKPFDI